MATPKNKITGNIEQNTGIEVASSPAVPPTDGNTNATVNGSIATTASGLYQRTGGSWRKLLAAGSNQSGIQADTSLVANATNTSTVVFPDGAVVTGIRLLTPVLFTTGAITVAIQNAAGTTILNAATFDLTGVSANTLTTLILTGTPADLIFAPNSFAKISIASDDAGATGGVLRTVFTLA